MTIEHIYLDMDDVLVDFTQGAFDHHRTKLDKTNSNISETVGIHKALNLTKQEFMNNIRRAGSHFWANLPVMDHTPMLLELLKRTNLPVTILTNPDASNDPNLRKMCIEGKRISHDRHFKDYRIVFEKDKEKYAKPTTLLIDDYIVNVEKFIGTGGHAILFPAFHNKMKQQEPILYTEHRLQLTLDRANAPNHIHVTDQNEPPKVIERLKK